MKTTPLENLEKIINYKFSDISLLKKALTHKSFANEHKLEDNERLEFLGDAILQLFISDFLLEKHPDFTEGMLSKFRSVLVSEEGLAEIAEHIQLSNFLLVGKGERISGGTRKKSILSDAFEAILAAIYLDSKKHSGTLEVAKVIEFLFKEAIELNEKTFLNADYKTELQELVQKRKLGELKYAIEKESGPDHNKEFSIAVMIGGEKIAVGVGKSKKKAERQAAITALENL